MDTPFIEVRGVSKLFPGVQVLTDIHLSFYRNEVHGLIGENGAGKSTLIKVLSGIHQPEQGELYLNGKKVVIKSPSHATELGISVIHQEFDLIPQMSVAQNMYLGREPKKRFGVVDFTTLYANTRHYLDKVRLNIPPTMLVADLSVEQKQLLAIAKALSQQALLIIMDEPTAALNGTEIEHLIALIHEIKSSGCAIIFISHHMEEVFEISDRITVLRDGHVVDTRMAADMDETTAIRLMTGKERVQKRLYGKAPGDNVVLDVRKLSHPKYFNNISFSLREGEIVGMVGLEGQGQRQILRALFGDICASSGEVLMHGEPVALCNPAAALAQGIVFVPEERKEEGLCLQLDIRQNLTLSTLRECSMAGVLKRGRKHHEALQTNMADVCLSTNDPARLVNSLSGGNQQKVVIAKCLACDPSVLLFSEPTRGIDVGAKEDIYLLIRKLADEGSCIVMVSGDITELLLVSDRILVVHAGKIVEEFPAESADREQIMRAMWGLKPGQSDSDHTKPTVFQL